MLNENARKWVEALRSGKYLQAHRQLSTGKNRYCCLGVLCEVAKKAGVINYYNKEGSYPPQEVINWVGLRDTHALYRTQSDRIRSLADDDNDNDQKSFAEIADIIESEPNKLFKE